MADLDWSWLMNLYWKAQIVATIAFALYGANTWARHEMHLRDTLPVVATVEKITRTCLLKDTQSDATKYGDCGGREYFNAQAYRDGKREDLEGKAVVSIIYTAPQDGSFQAGRLNFTGHDDSFYRLKAGDRIPIRVDRKDPARFTLD
jgi:hypothetical protein